MSADAKKVFIKTFGCQMNEYDSDKMADVLHAADGYEKTSNVDEAAVKPWPTTLEEARTWTWDQNQRIWIKP